MRMPAEDAGRTAIALEALNKVSKSLNYNTGDFTHQSTVRMASALIATLSMCFGVR